MKLRYTSLQVDTGAAEEHAPRACRRPRRHAGRRRQPPQPGAGGGRRDPGRRARRPGIAYVMTDGAALPLALSDLVADADGARASSTPPSPPATPSGATSRRCRSPSALALARHVAQADVAIVAMGPGVVGTGVTARHHRAGGRPPSSTPPARSAARPSRCCACPTATSASGTRASATTPAPRSTSPGRGARRRPDAGRASSTPRHDVREVAPARTSPTSSATPGSASPPWGGARGGSAVLPRRPLPRARWPPAFSR